MPKLYFRYGTMNSSKTANLLMVAHNYAHRTKPQFHKTAIDTRNGLETIKSRAFSHKEMLTYPKFRYGEIKMPNMSFLIVSW